MSKARAAIRRLPVKTVNVSLEDEYEGWEAVMRLNPPSGVWTALESGGDARAIVDVLPRILISWNFVDEQGEPLPDPREGGVKACPLDLLMILMKRYTEEITAAAALPKE